MNEAVASEGAGAVTDLIIDSFAGGGGASTGIEAATGRPVDIAATVGDWLAASRAHEGEERDGAPSSLQGERRPERFDRDRGVWVPAPELPASAFGPPFVQDPSEEPA